MKQRIPHLLRASCLIMFICVFAFARTENKPQPTGPLVQIDSAQYYREQIIEKVEIIRNDVLTHNHNP